MSYIPHYLRNILTPIVLLCLTVVAARADIYFEAEDYDPGASVVAPFELRTDPLASGGEYMVWPSTGGNQFLTSPSDTVEGQLHYTFTLAEQSDVAIWARVELRNANDNAFYFKIAGLPSGEPGADWIQTGGFAHRWGWIKVRESSWNPDDGPFYDVPAGTYTLKVLRREDDARIDAFFISTSGAEPPILEGLAPQWQPQESVFYEAEAVAGPDNDSGVFTRNTDPLASGGEFVEWSGTGQTSAIPASGTPGDLRFFVDVQQGTRDVQVWVRAKLPSANDDRFYYRFDDGTWQTQEGSQTGGWAWLSLGSYNSVAGVHTFEIAGGEDGVAIDQVYFSCDGSSPVGNDQYIEAENHNGNALFAPLEVRTDDPLASHGRYIVWPEAGQIDTTSGDSVAGQAHYFITVPVEGEDLNLWALVNFPSAGDNSFFYKIDGLTGWTEASASTSGWTWNNFATVADAPAGTYQLRILKREDGAKFDRFFVTTNGALPTAPVTSIESNAIYVAPWGNDNNDGSAATPFATLAAGAAQLQAGQTLYLREGTYTPQARVYVKDLIATDAQWTQILAFPGEKPVINGRYAPEVDDDGVLHVKDCRFVRVQGLTMINSQDTMLRVDSDHVEILDNTTEYSYGPGIVAIGNFVRILRNTIIDANHHGASFQDPVPQKQAAHEALSTWGLRDFEIAHNVLIDCHKEGIDTKHTHDRGIIHSNLLINVSHVAIYLDARGDRTDDLEVYNNLFRDCANALTMGAESDVPTGGFRDVRVHHNIAAWSWSGYSAGGKDSAPGFYGERFVKSFFWVLV